MIFGYISKYRRVPPGRVGKPGLSDAGFAVAVHCKVTSSIPAINNKRHLFRFSEKSVF
jgi:hypothetical protein